MNQNETKLSIEKKIKNHIVNVLFNVKGIEGVYPIDSASADTSKRIVTLDVIDSTKGILVNWASPKSVDIKIKVKVIAEISVMVTHNLLENLIRDQLEKLPKITLNNLFIEIEDVK